MCQINPPKPLLSHITIGLSLAEIVYFRHKITFKNMKKPPLSRPEKQMKTGNFIALSIMKFSAVLSSIAC